MNNFADFIGADNEGYDNIIRIGRKQENAEKPRPVKVTFKNLEEKKTLMKNLHKLRGIEEDSPYSNISVSHDMTKSEREANKTMIDEAKKMKTINRGNTFF